MQRGTIELSSKTRVFRRQDKPGIITMLILLRPCTIKHSSKIRSSRRPGKLWNNTSSMQRGIIELSSKRVSRRQDKLWKFSAKWNFQVHKVSYGIMTNTSLLRPCTIELSSKIRASKSLYKLWNNN